MSGGAWSEQVLEGHLAPGQAGDYYNVPFEMPPGVRRLEVRYAYSDPIGSDPHLTGGNTLDIGLFDARGADYPGRGFRGWSGSARNEFYIEPDDATPGYLPGPLDPGVWNVSLGFYKSGPDGCRYRITVRTLSGGAGGGAFPPLLTLANSPPTLAANSDGWYRGELHCHTYHSDGDSSPEAVVEAARALGLDFLAITDHNSLSHLAALAQLDPSGLALIPGCEVTTYKGHWNVWGLEEWIDFRTLTPDLMQQSIRRAAGLGYLTSCNHPRELGPPWEFKQLRDQRCIEVWNGPWQLFNTQALAYWEERLRGGERLTAVGGSDAHFLQQPHLAQIGTPTTWIFCAGQPTAAHLLAGLRAGHASLSESPDGPRLFLQAGGAMMGDALARPPSGVLDVMVRVLGGAGARIELIGALGLLAAIPVRRSDEAHELRVSTAETPYIRAQLVGEGDAVRALTNPIYLR